MNEEYLQNQTDDILVLLNRLEELLIKNISLIKGLVTEIKKKDNLID